MNTLIPFAHRRNPDASIDSICTTCFQTIASEYSVGKLIAHEERHSCDPYWQFFGAASRRLVRDNPRESRGTAQRCR